MYSRVKDCKPGKSIPAIIELNYKPLKQTQSKVYISVLSLVSVTRVHVHELEKNYL